jgi:hypothetical protein
MEGFFCRRFLSQLTRKLTPASLLIRATPLFLLQTVYEAVDSGNACAPSFFADFSKEFDRIDHHVLMQEVMEYAVPVWQAISYYL